MRISVSESTQFSGEVIAKLFYHAPFENLRVRDSFEFRVQIDGRRGVLEASGGVLQLPPAQLRVYKTYRGGTSTPFGTMIIPSRITMPSFSPF
jgi:hypothetical protein